MSYGATIRPPYSIEKGREASEVVAPYMKFCFTDQILELTPDRAVAVKNVTSAEEYLGDHFPSFPVLPGVFMLEVMVQAARAVLAEHGLNRMMLGEVKALRYGSFIRPGESLRVEVELVKQEADRYSFKGNGLRVGHGSGDLSDTAVSGRFTMRPALP